MTNRYNELLFNTHDVFRFFQTQTVVLVTQILWVEVLRFESLKLVCNEEGEEGEQVEQWKIGQECALQDLLHSFKHFHETVIPKGLDLFRMTEYDNIIERYRKKTSAESPVPEKFRDFIEKHIDPDQRARYCQGLKRFQPFDLLYELLIHNSRVFLQAVKSSNHGPSGNLCIGDKTLNRIELWFSFVKGIMSICSIWLPDTHQVSECFKTDLEHICQDYEDCLAQRECNPQASAHTHEYRGFFPTAKMLAQIFVVHEELNLPEPKPKDYTKHWPKGKLMTYSEAFELEKEEHKKAEGLVSTTDKEKGLGFAGTFVKAVKAFCGKQNEQKVIKENSRKRKEQHDLKANQSRKKIRKSEEALDCERKECANEISYFNELARKIVRLVLEISDNDHHPLDFDKYYCTDIHKSPYYPVIKLQLGEEEDVTLNLPTVGEVFSSKKCFGDMKPKKVIAHEINRFSFEALNPYINTCELSAGQPVFDSDVIMQRWKFTSKRYIDILNQSSLKANNANSSRRSSKKKLDEENPNRQTKSLAPKVLQQYEFIINRDVHVEIIQRVFHHTPRLPPRGESLEFLRVVREKEEGEQSWDEGFTC